VSRRFVVGCLWFRFTAASNTRLFIPTALSLSVPPIPSLPLLLSLSSPSLPALTPSHPCLTSRLSLHLLLSLPPFCVSLTPLLFSFPYQTRENPMTTCFPPILLMSSCLPSILLLSSCVPSIRSLSSFLLSISSVSFCRSSIHLFYICLSSIHTPSSFYSSIVPRLHSINLLRQEFTFKQTFVETERCSFLYLSPTPTFVTYLRSTCPIISNDISRTKLFPTNESPTFQSRLSILFTRERLIAHRTERF